MSTNALVVERGRPTPSGARLVERPSARPSAAAENKRPSEPWTQRDVTRVLAISAAGFLAIGVAWFGAGGTTSLSQQLLWTVLGITGIAITAVNQGMFVLDAFRVIKQRRIAVMTDIAAVVSTRLPAAPTAGATAAAAATPGADLRVAALSMTHFHRPDCMLVAGKDVPLHGSVDDHLAAGRTPCGVCAA